jgi:hypothetical protein
MKKRTAVLAAGVGLVAAVAGGGVAVASGDDDATVSGPQAEQATAAALAITHGGRANSVERDTENGATWEVEVTRKDGSTVDVRLDENYGLVIIEGDSDSQ